ncbi:hypothetical protein CP985_03315 [Malaciobacter mytili LMG 24559]|uniref:Uncharacterized protein n=1 Tax=Malaciobacter mytili LMG 24559 TaxID=1032238 RepID=A0AAX2AKB3_9BACT|nr:hypothetical protein [Malaciobacter mytili]AXH16387.1 hypothetical protein AMYT_a0088 [Malaciobacter mytili LMG 24559]RXK16453.1 hypothetical protein CP985_03315 [Malaciobacter mytili LMG 24559]
MILVIDTNRDLIIEKGAIFDPNNKSFIYYNKNNCLTITDNYKYPKACLNTPRTFPKDSNIFDKFNEATSDLDLIVLNEDEATKLNLNGIKFSKIIFKKSYKNLLIKDDSIF